MSERSVVRIVLAAVASCLALGCTGVEPPVSLDVETTRREPVPQHGTPTPPAPEPTCPAGTERRERGGEGPDALDWWCLRGEVRHGPFLEQEFDERDRTWHEVRGEHRDGERHGLVSTEGFYTVEHSGRSRVFRREHYDDGRVVRSNEASVSVALQAESPVVTHRFVVKARGVPPMARWEDEPAAIGSFDVEVYAIWRNAPRDAPPSILRAELRAPTTPEPRRADAILHPLDDTEPPATASELPPGYLPMLTATWRACDPAGCELELEVVLRWLTPGPGQLETYVTARAVPDTWPDAAPIEVTVIEPGAKAPGPR